MIPGSAKQKSPLPRFSRAVRLMIIDDSLVARTALRRMVEAADDLELLAAVSTALGVRPLDAALTAQIAVSNSVGTESPKLEAPPNACDCHMHIYDPARFPMVPSPRVAPTDAAVAHYRLLQKRLRTSRVVIVTRRRERRVAGLHRPFARRGVEVRRLAVQRHRGRGVKVVVIGALVVGQVRDQALFLLRLVQSLHEAHREQQGRADHEQRADVSPGQRPRHQLTRIAGHRASLGVCCELRRAAL